MTRFISTLTDGAPNPSIQAERPIYFGRSYRGQLTQWRGHGWTHSLHTFGGAAFASPDEAERDFWQTKEKLPQDVHAQIFGYERR